MGSSREWLRDVLDLAGRAALYVLYRASADAVQRLGHKVDYLHAKLDMKARFAAADARSLASRFCRHEEQDGDEVSEGAAPTCVELVK